MKTQEQLHAHQASLPPLRSYFIVWERPHGSYTWTQLGDMFTERDKANEFAKLRVDHKERPICDCVVSESKMARMPEPKGSEPVALLAELASGMEGRVKTVAEESSVTAAERTARKALTKALLICIRYADSSADTEQAYAALALAAKLQ